MKNIIAMIAVAGMAGVAGAETVANWGFNDQGLPAGGFGFEVTDLPQNADVGSGLFNVANFNNDSVDGVYSFIQSFSGTTTGSIDGVSGGSFAFQGATGQGVTNNGAQASVSFDGSNFENLTIDFARRGTSTGFNSLMIEIFDGTVSLGVVDTILGAQSSTWVASNYDLTALNGVADASVVFTFDGATSDTGNNRLDNITISGDAIPTPGALALLGMGGLVGARRRR
jgi:MYXO-CTERM domain-containing protein